jgi:phosphoglucosamine mutase
LLRFGTDGVRGVANVELTPELVLALGRAAARVLGPGPFLVARDTRRSGPLLESALIAGLTAEGSTVGRLGVLPTPGLAWLAAVEDVPAAMISASHNPFADNGVKFFRAGGRKLADDDERRLEAELDRLLHDPAAVGAPEGAAVGDVVDRPDGEGRYVDALVASIDGRRLDGLSVVVDCAHGAASTVGPEVLRRLGARVEVIGASPDGRNINQDAGSTHPAALQRAVVVSGADAGLALDGDADRVVAVDAAGEVVDGDRLMAVCALDLAARGRLRERTVVVTVMTNLGFRLAMAEAGITVVETPVGDRHVLAAIEEGGWSLGGEQSGHVIFRDLAATGDGVLTGVQVLDVVVRSGRTLADLAGSAMTRFPQILRNVTVRGGGTDVARAVAGEVAEAEAELGASGRVLIRPSGTEPLVRVMVEAPSAEQADAVAERLVRAVERARSA